MPTFDFFNVVRKIVSTALNAAFSPVTIVLGAAALITTCFESIIQFFNDDFNLPSIQIPSLSLGESSDLVNFLLYAVNFDTALTFINSTLSFVSSFIDFFVTFMVSLLGVLISVGSYKLVRRQIRDTVG